MLVMVREGPYDPADIARDGLPEPKGPELWSGSVEDITVVALRAVGVEVEPGEWYELARFHDLIGAARADPTGSREAVYSTVTTRHAGVAKPWETRIGIEERAAALMVCKAVVEHVRRLAHPENIWVRIE